MKHRRQENLGVPMQMQRAVRLHQKMRMNRMTPMAVILIQTFQMLQNLKFIYKQIKYYIFVFNIKPHCILNVFCTNGALKWFELHSMRIACPYFYQFEFQQRISHDSLE